MPPGEKVHSAPYTATVRSAVCITGRRASSTWSDGPGRSANVSVLARGGAEHGTDSGVGAAVEANRLGH